MTLANAGLYGPEAILSAAGTPATSMPVTVYLHGTTSAATLYTDNTMATGLANPVDTDSYGNLSFYAAPGLYDIAFSVGGVATTKTVVVDIWFSDGGHRTGEIIDTAETGLAGGGTLIDGSWMLADGTAISRTTYAKLFAALGGAASPWGQGDGSTTFNLPDLRGRVRVAAGSVGTNAQPSATIGEVGGEELHTLVQNELPTSVGTAAAQSAAVNDPRHNHVTDGNGNSANPAVYAIGSGGVVINGGAGGTAYQFFWTAGEVTADASTGISVTNAASAVTNSGGGAGHDNMQPFAVFQSLIKVI